MGSQLENLVRFRLLPDVAKKQAKNFNLFILTSSSSGSAFNSYSSLKAQRWAWAYTLNSVSTHITFQTQVKPKQDSSETPNHPKMT